MKKKIAIIINNDIGLYNFRKELLERLIQKKYKVIILLPKGEKIKDLQRMGCIFEELYIDRRGTNPFKDLKLLMELRKKVIKIRPDIILTYTIKPNIYGGIISQLLGIPYIANITGLGSVLENPGILQKIAVWMYRVALKNANCVFCQNKENFLFVKNKGLTKKKVRLLPGSGVNLQNFFLQEYPPDGILKFVFVSRIMKEKGINEYLEAATKIKQKYPDTQFHICGFCEEEFTEKLEKFQLEEIVEYHGMVSDIGQILKDMHCVILPSYHEGMSNALLEGAATGRPLIASDIPGCRECLQNQKSGFLVKPRDARDLTEKIEQFIQISYAEKKKMGLASRIWVEQHFDRDKVVDTYIQEIQGGIA